MKIGDKIKSFQIKHIVKKESYNYSSNGRKTKYVAEYFLLLSDDGQERILESNKTSLTDCESYIPTWGKTKFTKSLRKL